MSAVLETQLPLAGALGASLLVHALAAALLPGARPATPARVPAMEWVMVQAISPAPAPPSPLPVRPPPPATRALHRRVEPPAPRSTATAADSEGEVAAPVSQEPLRFLLQPYPLGSKQEAPPATPLPVPAVETEPVLESEVRPPYPKAALEEGIEGTVALRVMISEEGAVVSAVVEWDPGYGLGDAARIAVTRARFRPATRNGKPVRSTITWRYTFILD